MSKRWYVYLLEATARTGRVTVHVGIALDPARRMEDHRAGRVKQTRGRSIALIGVSPAPVSKSKALQVEAHLKTLSPANKRRVARSWNRYLVN